MNASRALFTSDRERRLWSLVIAVIVAVYSTLGLAGTLAARLGEHGMLAASFAAGFILVLAAIGGIAIVKRPGQREIWAGIGIIAAYAMIIVRMGVSPAERTHLFEYGLVAVLVYQALLERSRSRRVPLAAGIAVAVTAVLGSIDEGIQWLLPNRVFDVRDVAINAVAGLMAVLASLVLARVRRADADVRG